MSSFRAAAKYTPRLIEIARQQQGLASLPRHSQHRLLCSAAQQPNQGSAFDPFHQTSSSGPIYARLYGATKHTSKTDVLNLLSGCNLTVDDIKHDYTLNFLPLPVLVKFPSRQAYDAGTRSVVKKGRFRLEPENGSRFDTIAPYDGKAILLQGIPRNALIDDVERFLAGCTYDSSSIQMFYRLFLRSYTFVTGLEEGVNLAVSFIVYLCKHYGFLAGHHIRCL
ncbi:OLC1v1034704C2 [Oldenlandia corymbosa var. corymbosa]|uniref:OLC1v1034704C2 n=1 Tax=Oldenlandia corymbosa var. corymbosa TaxID=529605 RepID=A0AAV1CR45_OLDCO|nr:OLC1v1034704C2 [Oldenlandia corymbosa var. corymbosa]